MYKISVLLKATDQPPFRYQGEEAAAEARTRFPTLSGYVQTSPLADQPEVPFAGALELYFASVEALSIGDVDRWHNGGLCCHGRRASGHVQTRISSPRQHKRRLPVPA